MKGILACKQTVMDDEILKHSQAAAREKYNSKYRG
jgi:hypothetical protein